MRPRFRIRTLMVLVALVAVGMFVVRTKQRWREFHEVAADYELLEAEELLEARAMDGLAARYLASADRFRRLADPASPEYQPGSENAAEVARGYEQSAARSRADAQARRARAAEAARMKRYYRSRWW